MDTNILLESGTNELEILEFTVGGNHYGINVAKIREIVIENQDAQNALIKSGLNAGDIVILSNVQQDEKIKIAE